MQGKGCSIAMYVQRDPGAQVVFFSGTASAGQPSWSMFRPSDASAIRSSSGGRISGPGAASSSPQRMCGGTSASSRGNLNSTENVVFEMISTSELFRYQRTRIIRSISFRRVHTHPKASGILVRLDFFPFAQGFELIIGQKQPQVKSLHGYSWNLGLKSRNRTWNTEPKGCLEKCDGSEMRKTRSHVLTCNAVKFHTNSTRTNSLSQSVLLSTHDSQLSTATLHKPVALLWNSRTQAICQTVPIPCSLSDSHGMPEPRPHARQSLSHAHFLILMECQNPETVPIPCLTLLLWNARTQAACQTVPIPCLRAQAACQIALTLNSNCKSQVPNSVSCFSLWAICQRKLNYRSTLSGYSANSAAANFVELYASLLVEQDENHGGPRFTKEPSRVKQKHNSPCSHNHYQRKCHAQRMKVTLTTIITKTIESSS